MNKFHNYVLDSSLIVKLIFQFRIFNSLASKIYVFISYFYNFWKTKKFNK